MTEHQKQIQDHLANKTLEIYLQNKAENGSGLKAKLENLMIQLQKNCNHLDLLGSQFNQSCKGFVILMMAGWLDDPKKV